MSYRTRRGLFVWVALSLVPLVVTSGNATAETESITVEGDGTAPTVTVTPGAGEALVEWDPVSGAQRHRYRLRQGDGEWSANVQVGADTSVSLIDLVDGAAYTVAVGTRVADRWRNDWTEVPFVASGDGSGGSDPGGGGGDPGDPPTDEPGAGDVTVLGAGTGPTVTVRPGAGEAFVEWVPVSRAQRHRYRLRQGAGVWSAIVQVGADTSVTLTGLVDGAAYTVAVGTRVANRWRNDWTEVPFVASSGEVGGSDPPPDLVVADYVHSTGLAIDSADGLGHTFGKPCVADLDGIDPIDIVWSNHYDGPWDVYLGVPNGTWAEDLRTDWSEGDLLSDTSPTDPTLPHKDSHGCAVADFDGDGRADIYEAVGACIGSCAKHEGLWIQQPDGSFVNEGRDRIAPSPTTDRSRFPVVIDGDNDGDPDLYVSAAAVTGDDSQHRYFRNDGGVLGEATSGAENNGRQVNCTVAADVNGDAKVDLIVCRQFRVDFFKNIGNGVFRRVWFGMSGVPLARSVDVRDVNRDGQVDLLFLTDDELQIRLGRSGKFPVVDYRMAVVGGRDVVTPDIDGDGNPDIYVLATASGSGPEAPDADFLLHNRGGMRFDRIDTPQSQAGRGDTAVVLADFWSSGHDAVLVSNGFFGTVGDRQVLALEGLEPPIAPAQTGQVTFSSAPGGVEVRLNGDIVALDTPVDIVVGQTYVIAAADTVELDGRSWTFDAWSDGGAPTHEIIFGPWNSRLQVYYE